MKLTVHSSKSGLLWLILGALVFFACGGPESDFEKIKKLNTVAAYNKFVQKYPDNPLANEAVNLRDQLAFEMTSDSASVDSLAPLKANVLENLIANAEQIWRNAENNKNDAKSAEEFANAAEFYRLAAGIQKIVGKDTTEAYKRAAYAYYKAARRSQALQMASAISAFNNWVKQLGRLSAGELRFNMAAAIIPHHLEKSVLYEKSAGLFRKAGMEKHADWMMDEGTIKTFDLQELELASDTVKVEKM